MAETKPVKLPRSLHALSLISITIALLGGASLTVGMGGTVFLYLNDIEATTDFRWFLGNLALIGVVLASVAVYFQTRQWRVMATYSGELITQSLKADLFREIKEDAVRELVESVRNDEQEKQHGPA